MILKNYKIQYDMDGFPIVATGQVFGNPKFKDGTFVVTSKIISYNMEKNVITTMNSVYELEK